MRELLKRNRTRINEEFVSYETRKHLSAATYADSVITVKALSSHVHGKCIDIGCGDMPYRKLIEDRAEQYDSLDMERRVPDVKFIGSVQDMNMIENSTYDSALCLEVLEHVRDPFKAVSEINRIMKPGGILVCSVPHLSRLHEEPNDYFRYTKYGLTHLFESSGFEMISIEPRGGLFCFLAHQVSLVLLLPIWHVPLLKRLIFFANKLLFVRAVCLFDGMLDKSKVFALGYTCVVRKK
jgi:SAM-dependent methyltransferase